MLRPAQFGLLVVTVVTSSCSLTFAEDKSAEGEKAFKDFGEFMVGGVWTRTDEEGNDLEHTYQWTLNDRFVQGRSLKDPTPFLMTIGVDPVTGKMTSWAFHGDGGVGGGTWEKTGPDEWTAKGYSSGRKTGVKGTWVLRRIDKDKLNVKSKVKKDGDDVQRDVTWTRRGE